MNQDRGARPGRGAPPAASVHPLCPGDLVFLTPRTAGAPTAAYKEPQVRVVKLIPLSAEVTVELPDGALLTTNSANIVRRRPEHRPRRTSRPARRPALDLAPDQEEVPLW